MPDLITDLITDAELVRRFPGQPLSHDSAAHYRGRLARKLLINRCAACGTWHHAPQPICPACWSTDVVPTEVAGTGTIHLAVFLHQGPPAEGVDYSTPYPVVTVELDEQPGLRFTGTVVGSPNEAVAIGKRVTLDWIDRAGTPVPAFRLVESSAS
ncbi:MAG: OB-fold domain-containing protein [Actinomycetota bacterium]|nr:OB-fold domain-containing protein [Actinomycetota bacterium]